MRARWITFVAAIALLGALPACGGGGSGGDGEASPWPQTLATVSPPRGSTLGGTRLELSGSGFLNPRHPLSGIRFGPEPVTDWQIVDDRTIRLTAPPGRVGHVTVFILGENGPLDDGILLAAGYEYTARTVYVAEGGGAANPILYRVDLDAGRVAQVGPIGFAIEGMAMDPDGVLWGVEGGPPHRLVRIDPELGTGLGVGVLLDSVTRQPVEILDLTFLGERLLGRASGAELVEIDLTYGTVTRLSSLDGVAPGGGLALGGDGAVVLAPEDGRLYRWDSLDDVAGAGPRLRPAAVVEAIAVSGYHIYGIDGDPASEDHVDLYRIDPATGESLPVLELPPHVGAIARDR